MSQAKQEGIFQNKENKIKILFSQFESLKKKILICEQQRREETAEVPRPQSKKKHEKQRQSLQPRRDEEKQIMKLKLEKYEQLLRQKSEMFEDKEQYLKKALKQQKLNLQHLRETYESKLRRATKLIIPYTPQQLLSKLNFFQATDKLSLHQKRLVYLGEMVEELRRAFQLRAEKQDAETEEMIKEKLALEVALAEKEDRIGELEREMEERPQQDMQEEMNQKLQYIQVQRKQENALLTEKLRGLEEEIEGLGQEKEKARLNYEDSISKLELEFREEIKHYTKKQEQLEEAERQAAEANTKLNKTLKQQRQVLEQAQLELTQCRKQLQTLQTQVQQLRLQKETLDRQSRLSTSTYQAQAYTLRTQLAQQTENCQQFEARIAELESTIEDIESGKKSLEKKIEAMMKKNIDDEKTTKETNTIMQSFEKQLKDLVDKLAKEKKTNIQMKDLWNEEKMQLGSKIQQLQNTVSSKDKEIQRLAKQVSKVTDDLKKQAAAKSAPGALPMQTRKEIEKYQSEISELRIMLEASQQQLESIRTKSQGASKQTSSGLGLKELEEKNKEVQALQVKNKSLAQEKASLQKRISQNTRIIQQSHGKIRRLEDSIKQQDIKYKQLVQETQSKDKIIEELKERKAGFESLAIQFSKGTDELKKKHIIQPKSNEKRIASSINDIQIRMTKSDTSECVEERAQQIQQPHPITRTRTPTMLYSFNLTGQRQLLQKIKNLEKQLDLAHLQNMKRQKLEEDLNSMQMDQERILNQKQILKTEVNTLNHEIAAIKDQVRKLLALLLVENKKAFRGNVAALKECAAKVFKLILPEGELALSHMFMTNLDDKKGIFSIL